MSRPAVLKARRSGAPAQRDNGMAEKTSSETPREKGVACSLESPAQTSSAPNRIARPPQTREARPVPRLNGSGRSRMAVTMLSRLTRQAEIVTTMKVSTTPIA